MKSDIFNKWFNIFILAGMMTAVAVLNVVKLREPDARILWQGIATVGALTGVVNVILSAKGSIWNYLFGLIDVLAMTAVTLESSLDNANPTWGLFVLHAVFLLPMQFVGIWQWRKRGAGSARSVNPRRLTSCGWMVVVACFVALIAVLYYVLDVFGTKGQDMFNVVILFDTVVVALSIVGQVLMSLAYSDQWFIWISVNLCSVGLFWFKSRSSEPDAYTVVYMVKYIFYFLNSLNGLRIWLALSRKGRDSFRQAPGEQLPN